jgi:hypothetical protein
MRSIMIDRPALAALIAVALLAWPGAPSAQAAGGQAKAVQASVLGLLGTTTTTLADTGVLPPGATDALHASAPSGTVPSLLSGDSLHAATIGSPERVVSEASIGSLGITVAGIGIAADFVMARAQAAAGGAGTAASEILGLRVNGVSVPVSGEPNQTIAIPGGRLVLNEQQTGPGAALVNALHVVVTGVADVVVASAAAATP